ncbi:hypothetical protein PAMA_014053 [Pampus argenteus]
MQSPIVQQARGFISAAIGDNLHLQCFYNTVATKYYWYKQALGQQPKLMSSNYKYNNGTFYDEFKNNQRFILENENGKNILQISNLHLSDSATYYCARSYLYNFELAGETIVSVKGSGLNIQASVHQSASESIQPGGSVTLNCTVHTGTCDDGEHSVYWFKDSQESHPGIIYTHGGRNDQCERNDNTQTHTCVYNLPMKSLNLSHAGTYYCAVASCGQILFGDGTKLDSEPAQETKLESSFSVHQDTGFVSVNVGEELYIKCFYKGNGSAWLYWYKQSLGQKPRLISTFYVNGEKKTFHDEFKNNQRFKLDAGNGTNHLMISELRLSDSATYYCASSYSSMVKFAEGTIVSVKGSGLNIQASVHQSASESIQPGGSVTLNCTVHTGTCDDGEHSVYWFKESHPGIIYTHGGRNDQCEKNNNTQTHTCVYNLPMKSLNLSHAGTYYCAVASCGQILFGDGTKLDSESAQGTKLESSFSVHKDTGFVSVNVGEKLSLQCFYEDDVSAWLYWYKQSLGQKPRLISDFYVFDKNGTFHDEFKNNPRFKLDAGNGKNHLMISELRLSDSATYYCASTKAYKVKFEEGITVSVKGSGLNIQASVHQSASESIQPGGSVTLNCTVHTGTCDDGEHSVYWFKNSQESHPGIIYTHGGRNDQCERNNNTQTHTCVYNLPMKSLNLSHAGTYYCAVASCGQILFGDGTKLDSESAQETKLESSFSVHQDTGFVSVNVGEKLSLQCFYKGNVSSLLYWYKQSLGQKPRLISDFYVCDKNGTFHDEFKNNQRFTLDAGNGKNHLMISELRLSDSATYYCASRKAYNVKFEEGITVSVKGSGLNIQASVHQSASESIQPGGSVTLNCTVHTGTCDDGEHSVYWFKDSHPGIIYTHGGRNDQCERNDNTQTHTCVYNLPMKSLNLSHAGSYYCAVASCGQILFGDGTKLDSEPAQGTKLESSFSVHQDTGFVSVNVGEKLSLQCFYKGNVSSLLYWYKQSLGQKPRLISDFYVFDKNGTFHDEFKNNQRFTLDAGNGTNHLMISELRLSDSATYYCASRNAYNVKFEEGITVSVKGSGLNIQASVHQSASESIQPGGSVTLNCTVHTGTCDDGEHSVYWFKDSHPGIIYTHGGRNDQCERNNNTQTHTCVYNLPMKSLNLSHAGTYYCAVASCGQILFGDGTKLDSEPAQGTKLESSFSVHKDTGFVSVNVGEKLSLQCFYEGNVTPLLYWYKQSLGQKPRLISTYYVNSKKKTFHDELENNPRFKLNAGNGKNHLMISELRLSDSATYYCASRKVYTVKFEEGITVSVKGSGLNIQASVHQSASESIQPGGSVTLNCTVHTETCDDGEHSVYWFKNSQESHPGIIYTHGGRNDQCERNDNTQTHTCVYNLPMKSLNLSHAGTYYCAVASCGQILFGDGTKLDSEPAQETKLESSFSVHQDTGFVSVNVGEKLSLQCFYKGNVSSLLYWYKQSLGQKPRIISAFYVFDKNGTFHDEFKNNPRFKLDVGNGKNHLMISELRPSDSATYYCASRKSYKVKFEEGITVSVKGSGLNIQASVHQSASESIQPGGSVTLNCTVHTGTCDDGEHSVYWFKDSHPGIIYTHGGRNDQCERNNNTQTHTCVYNLPMKSLNLSHAGTYYCAVASCGQILFGDGTKLDSEHEVVSLVLVYFLNGALAFTTIFSVLLAYLVYKLNKRNSLQSTVVAQPSDTTPPPATSELGAIKEMLHILAVENNSSNSSQYSAAQGTKLESSFSVHKDTGFVSVNVGEKLSLQCFYEGNVTAVLCWYKQSLGQKPRLISDFYVCDKNGTFHNEFKNNPRFKLDAGKGTNHLMISELRPSDSATYYCASRKSYKVKFEEGITVSVKGSGLNIQASVHQSASESIQPGGSVTLNCTVHTGTCDDGEHSVYWFKHSQESHPGIIYTHGGRNDQCERNNNTQTHTCVYNLPMKSLNLSHAGTYYCAVALCGQILFGNGTKLDSEPAQGTKLESSFSVQQDTGFVSVNVGEKLSLQCSYEGDVLVLLYWYKQSLGQKPRLIADFYMHAKVETFYDEFKNNPRFKLDAGNGKNHLMISELRLSDSATYYCASTKAYNIIFEEGITVSVKGSGLNIQASVHQSASESIQPGGSVTLNCTVHTGTCDDGEHSVYWFKNSQESHPGIIYTHGGRNDQCERNNNTQTHTCVYNLPMKSLNLSHAGTYYCAVASCGQILFGDGTKLDSEPAQGTKLESSFSVHQDTGFVSVNVGEKLSLQCFYEGNVSSLLYWYKQSLGQKPRLISDFYVCDTNGTFHNEFKNNQRFTLDAGNSKNHLMISELRLSDSATYYCASRIAYTVKFEEGITVSVKGSGLNIQASVHQSASIQPGGSVTLNCTVHTGTCDDGEHSVYWFKDSHPGIIYTHGGRNDQCERNDNTQTHTCVYNLPMKSLDLSHAGTYYCAVASCGQILFGDGTKLDYEHDEDSHVLVYVLSGALAITTILIVLLPFLVCVINKRNSCQCKESHARFSAPSTTDAEGHQNEENIHYAALSEHRSRRQRNNTKTECVYSSVKP